MPVSENKKTFFISPVSAFFHTLAPPDQWVYLDLLLTGLNMHELTHTRQLPFVISQILEAQEKYKLPESIDDNSIQRTFENNEAYKTLFFKEKTHLWNAAMTGNLDSCKKELKIALDLAAERQRTFFVQENEGYKILDDIPSHSKALRCGRNTRQPGNMLPKANHLSKRCTLCSSTLIRGHRKKVLRCS